MVLVLPAVRPLEEARAAAAESPRVLVTDRFAPALAANHLANVMVSHGGQGTVQTALAAGTPPAGVALQMEQQSASTTSMDAGAGASRQRQRWPAPIIRRAVRTVLADPGYRPGGAGPHRLELRAQPGGKPVPRRDLIRAFGEHALRKSPLRAAVALDGERRVS